jgi:hypothetical protein
VVDDAIPRHGRMRQYLIEIDGIEYPSKRRTGYRTGCRTG